MRARASAGIAGLVLLGTLALQAAWILTVAPFAGIDEVDHVFRASSVAEGHVLPTYRRVAEGRGRGELVAVRDDIVAAARLPCRSLRYNGPDNCVPLGRAGPGQVFVASSAARYNPVYYAIVGPAGLPFHGRAAMYAMRAASALLSALVLAASVWALVRRGGRPWSLLALLVAVTPTTLYSTALAAPNGINLVSGIGLWVALVGLLVGPTPPDRGDRRVLLTLGVVSAALLVTTHTLGAVWLAIIAPTVVLAAGPRRVRARILAHPRPYLLATLGVVVLVTAVATWALLAGTNRTAGESGAGSYGDHPFPIVLIGLLLWPLQAIAAFPSRSQAAAPGVYALVVPVVFAGLMVGWRYATRRLRRAVVAIVAMFYAVPLVFTVATYADLGLAWQGRYALPLAVGIPLLLGLGLDTAGIRVPSALAVGAPLVMVAAQLVSWHSVVDRLLHRRLWRASTVWHAPAPALLVVLSLVALCCWAAAVVLARPVVDPHPDPQVSRS